MEYAKDIVIGINKGQDLNKPKKAKKRRIINKIMNHKFIALIIFTIISFMVLDFILISNFINLLLNV